MIINKSDSFNKIKTNIINNENLKLASIGLLTGGVASIIGGGAEILIVPALVGLKLVGGYKEAVGTSLASLLPPIGVFAVYYYYKS